MTALKIIIPVILISALVVGLWSYSAYRIDKLENRMHELECRHVLHEDFSTTHQDGELTRVCLGR